MSHHVQSFENNSVHKSHRCVCACVCAASSLSDEKICSIKFGLEPNYYDEGCKSFFICDNKKGSLHVCPLDLQFHWEKLECLKVRPLHTSRSRDIVP